MGCHQDPLIRRVCELYDEISNLESLKPCKDVNTLFTQLVITCMPPNYPIDVTKLCMTLQDMRSNLIKLCGQAESLLESHFSELLSSSSYKNPIDHLHIFPYFTNYLKLGRLEFTLLSQHLPSRGGAEQNAATRMAFVGSGPLPLTSIVLASNHMTTTVFHNYDIDPSANSQALKLVSPDPDLSTRMVFHTANIMDVTCALKEYEVIFLAALVGMEREEKIRVIEHLGKHMASGAILMLRSAHGARAFLYPVVDEANDLKGFDVLSVYHPTDEVINSVIIARKKPCSSTTVEHQPYHLPQQQQQQQGLMIGSIMMPTKCCDIHQCFSPLSHGNMVEELTVEDPSS